jgi:hypothetical protein
MIAAVAFATGVFLVIYESTKPGGFDKTSERHIVVYSVVFGLLAALLSFGLIGGSSMIDIFRQ